MERGRSKPACTRRNEAAVRRRTPTWRVAGHVRVSKFRFTVAPCCVQCPVSCPSCVYALSRHSAKRYSS